MQEIDFFVYYFVSTKQKDDMAKSVDPGPTFFRNSGNLPRIFIMLVAELTPYVISETLIEDEIRGQNLYCQPVSLFPNNKSCSRHKLFQNFGFDECEVW